MNRPVVLLPACQQLVDGEPSHRVGQAYTDVLRWSGALPLIVPSARPDDIEALLELADGLLLTGSPSNVEPRHFGQEVLDAALPLDPLRDRWTLPLIPKALARGLPLLAICRGLQEMNVALGGSLHQALHTRPGGLDHRDDPDDPLERQYGPAHSITLQPGGVLAALLAGGGRSGTVAVNSLHGQGVDRLADGLRVEALAPDGVIEAFSQPSAPGFNLAVQWHPEWQAADNPVSRALFEAFGSACRRYREHRQHRR